MSRGSFSRTVARAAASGGSRAYRGKSPRAWYALITAITLIGVFLIAYSRNERIHPYVPPAVHPTASDHWYSALGVDICGKLQADLPANPNFTTVGIRTAGDGVILIAPGAATKPSSFTGKHDTLGTFFGSYPGASLTATSIQLPGRKALANGDSCTAALGPARGKAHLVVETWSSAKAKTGTIVTADPTSVKLLNGMLLTVGFVPPHTALQRPSSVPALLGDLNGTAVSAPPAAPTSTVPATTSPAQAGSASSSTVAGSTASTTAKPGTAKSGVSATSGTVAHPATTVGAAGVATH